MEGKLTTHSIAELMNLDLVKKNELSRYAKEPPISTEWVEAVVTKLYSMRIFKKKKAIAGVVQWEFTHPSFKQLIYNLVPEARHKVFADFQDVLNNIAVDGAIGGMSGGE